MGAAHGNRIKNRTAERPGNFSCSVRARILPRTMTRTWDTRVKMTVLVSADRKMELLIARRKLVAPTNCTVWEPVVALLTLRYRANRSGRPTSAAI